MRTHTNNYKNIIKSLGREIEAKITYTNNGTTITIDNENINSMSLHYEGAILKSVMKQLDLDINVDIPLNTVLTAQFGVKVNGAYEYLTFGDFIVYKSEKQEDTLSYKLTCYDKMLYSMKDYEAMEITYPITISDYINAICSHLGLTFKNNSEDFANYDKTIPNELYLDSDGNSLGYTFRDVLDELAEVTASTICVDGDELEIRYITAQGTRTQVQGSSIHINDAVHEGFLYDGVNNINVSGDLPIILKFDYLKDTNKETIDEEFLKDVNVNFGEKYGPVNTIALTRAEADTIAVSRPLDLADENKVTIEIKDNQIMQFNDRADFIPDILNKLYGLEYYLNDFASTGITYLDLCDKYYVKVDDKTYPCIMFNDEINVNNGLVENIYTEMPKQAEVEYKHTTTDDKIAQVQLSVNKQQGYIEALAEDINGENGIVARLDSQQAILEVKTKNIDENGNVTEVTTTTGFTFNADGLNISKSNTEFNAQHTNEGSYYRDGATDISIINTDGLMGNNFKQRGLHQYSWDGDSYNFSRERVEITYTDEFGVSHTKTGYGTFYNG